MYSRSAGAKANNLTAVKYGSIFLITALAVAAPWLVRNYIWTGNPLYPLFKNIFNPATQQAATGGMDIFTLRRLFFNETSLQILLLPLRIFFEGQDNNPQYFDGKLNPFLLFLPFFAFIKQTDAPIVKLEKKAMLAFCILFFLFALFQSGMRIRYISPMIPFLVILSMFGLKNIITFSRHHALSRIRISGYLLSVFLVTAMLLYNGKYLLEQFRYVQPFDYISGKINRDEYITRYRPEYPVVQYANKQLQAGSKTLCLFLGNRGYYMDFPHIFDVPTNSNSPFSQLIATSSDATAIQKALLKDEYHHILLRNDLTTSWINHLGEHREITVFFFQHNLELMYSTKDYSLLRINSLPNNHREIIQ